MHVPSQNEAADMASWGKHFLHVVLIVFFVYVFEDRFAIGILRDVAPADDDEASKYHDSPTQVTGPASAIFMAILFVSRLVTLLYLYVTCIFSNLSILYYENWI